MAPAPRARRPRHRLRDRRSGRDAAGHRAHGDDPGPGRDLTCAGRGHCSLLGDELRWRAAELPESLVAIVDVALALELGEGTVVAAPVDGHGCCILPGLERAGRHAAERGATASRRWRYASCSRPIRPRGLPAWRGPSARGRAANAGERARRCRQTASLGAAFPPARTRSAGCRCQFRFSLCIFRSGRSGTALIQQEFPCPDHQRTWSGQSGHQLRYLGGGSGGSERWVARSGPDAQARMRSQPVLRWR